MILLIIVGVGFVWVIGFFVYILTSPPARDMEQEREEED